MEKNYKVSCFGAGFVGLPTSSVLAVHNPDINVQIFIIFSLLSLISMSKKYKVVHKEKCLFLNLIYKKLLLKFTIRILLSATIFLMHLITQKLFSWLYPHQQKPQVKMQEKLTISTTLKKL